MHKHYARYVSYCFANWLWLSALASFVSDFKNQSQAINYSSKDGFFENPPQWSLSQITTGTVSKATAYSVSLRFSTVLEVSLNWLLVFFCLGKSRSRKIGHRSHLREWYTNVWLQNVTRRNMAIHPFSSIKSAALVPKQQSTNMLYSLVFYKSYLEYFDNLEWLVDLIWFIHWLKFG